MNEFKCSACNVDISKEKGRNGVIVCPICKTMTLVSDITPISNEIGIFNRIIDKVTTWFDNTKTSEKKKSRYIILAVAISLIFIAILMHFLAPLEASIFDIFILLALSLYAMCFYNSKQISNEESINTTGVWIAYIFTFLILGCILTAIGNNQNDKLLNKGNVRVPESSYSLVGQNYNTVKEKLEKAGFQNIQIQGEQGNYTSNKVQEISINGRSNFKKSEWFDPNSIVILKYYNISIENEELAISIEDNKDESEAVPDKPNESDGQNVIISKEQIIGTYVGQDGSLLTFLEDGTVDYFYYKWNRIESGHEWSFNDNVISWTFSTYNTKITGRITDNDINNIYFTALNFFVWTNENYKRISDESKHWSLEESRNLVSSVYPDLVIDNTNESDNNESSKEDTNNNLANTEKMANEDESKDIGNNTYAITNTRVKLRADSNTDCDVLDILDSGEQVEVIGNMNDEWCKVIYNQKEGFIKSEFLSQISESSYTPLGVNLDTIVSTAKSMGVSIQENSDTDFKHGSFYKSLEQNKSGGIYLNIIYLSDTKEVLSISIRTNSATDKKEQDEFILKMAEVTCSDTNTEEIVNWIKNNLNKNAERKFNNHTYTLETTSSGRNELYIGEKEWEEWDNSFGDD